MNNEKHQKRHFYPTKDTSVKKKRFKWFVKRLKRLNGVANDVNVAAFYPLIMEYTMRNTKLDRIDIETLLRVAKYNRVVDKYDFHAVPNGFQSKSTNAQFLRLEQRGFIERWEGHNMNYRRKIQYKLTSRARIMITNFDLMLVRMKKVPLDPSYSDLEFVTPRVNLENNRYKIDWHAEIVAFNKEVDKEKLNQNN
ncbi:MAG: hypothetical protein ACEPOW_13800 [Bacteroidales bacterium]